MSKEVIKELQEEFYRQLSILIVSRSGNISVSDNETITIENFNGFSLTIFKEHKGFKLHVAGRLHGKHPYNEFQIDETRQSCLVHTIRRLIEDFQNDAEIRFLRQLIGK